MVKVEKPVRFDTKSFHALFEPLRESYNDVILTNRLRPEYWSFRTTGFDSVLERMLETETELEELNAE